MTSSRGLYLHRFVIICIGDKLLSQIFKSDCPDLGQRLTRDWYVYRNSRLTDHLSVEHKINHKFQICKSDWIFRSFLNKSYYRREYAVIALPGKLVVDLMISFFGNKKGSQGQGKDQMAALFKVRFPKMAHYSDTSTVSVTQSSRKMLIQSHIMKWKSKEVAILETSVENGAKSDRRNFCQISPSSGLRF